MTPQVLSELLLVCLGLLLGTTWTYQALQFKHRRQVEERRRLNEERRRLDEDWAAVRATRRQRGQCPRCGAALSERRSQPR